MESRGISISKRVVRDGLLTRLDPPPQHRKRLQTWWSAGQPWQENLGTAGFLSVAVSIIAASLLVLLGLRTCPHGDFLVVNVRDNFDKAI
jgi:hypothetical protein